MNTDDIVPGDILVLGFLRAVVHRRSFSDVSPGWHLFFYGPGAEELDAGQFASDLSDLPNRDEWQRAGNVLNINPKEHY